jgi:hypothetical protein
MSDFILLPTLVAFDTWDEVIDSQRLLVRLWRTCLGDVFVLVGCGDKKSVYPRAFRVSPESRFSPVDVHHSCQIRAIFFAAIMLTTLVYYEKEIGRYSRALRVACVTSK